jgi:outer membrane lipoprotein-sorting protein
MKKGIVFVLILAAGVFPAKAQNAGEPDAESIMRAVKERIMSDTMSSRSRMVITAKNGSATELVIDQHSKDDAKGYARTIIIFQSPATVRGTRFLMLDRESGKSDQMIFLPGPGKVRRVAASEGGDSFMGTDFSYDDMSSMDRETGLDTHTVLGEETLDGAACYIIQSVPKDKNFLYSKTVSWIDKTSCRVYKREMYDKRGNRVKVMEVSGYQDIQGRDTPTRTKVSTIAAGTFTTIYMDIIKYDDPVPEGVFTTAYLETGRVR